MIAEIPITLAFLYPSLNLWWFKKNLPIVEKEIIHESNVEGIEIYKYVNKHTSPTYVNVGHVMLPINNSESYQECKLFNSKYFNNDKIYNMYSSIDEDKISSIKHINTSHSLHKIFKKYNMNENEHSITLPLKMNHYNYTNGAYLHNSGILSGNRDKLIKKVLFNKRLPLTLTIASVATAYLAGSWIKYYYNSQYDYYNSQYEYYKYTTCYPPFHYKRFQNNFK